MSEPTRPCPDCHGWHSRWLRCQAAPRACHRCHDWHPAWLPCRRARDVLAVWVAASGEQRRHADLAETTAIERFRAYRRAA
jgi:hypothetical protein